MTCTTGKCSWNMRVMEPHPCPLPCEPSATLGLYPSFRTVWLLAGCLLFEHDLLTHCRYVGMYVHRDE